MMIIMVWLSQAKWAVDDATSHGISERQSSRLGGLALVLGACAYYLNLLWMGEQWVPELGDAYGFTLPLYYWLVLLIALVGLCDDLAVNISPGRRLFLVLALAYAAVAQQPEIVPPSAYAWLPGALNNSVTLTVAGAILVAGFVNAGNMADGANGLMAIIGLSFFAVASWINPAGYYLSVILALFVFLIFNVSTGQIFRAILGLMHCPRRSHLAV